MSIHYPVYCSCIICHAEMTTSNLANHNYNLHQHIYPKLKRSRGKCKQCEQLIFSSFVKSFCDSSCAALYNNAMRPAGHPSRIQNNQSRSTKAIKSSLQNKTKRDAASLKFTKVSQCKSCSKWFPGRRKTCSTECLITHLTTIANARPKHFRPANRINIVYNGVKLGSEYELTVCKSLDANNISWNVPSWFTYPDLNGKFHKYYPDLYLPEYDIYLDPKNDYLINNPNPYHGYCDLDKIKWAENFNNITVIVLSKDNLDWQSIKSILSARQASNLYSLSRTDF